MKVKHISHDDMDGKMCNVVLDYFYKNVDHVNTNYKEVNDLVKCFIDSGEYEKYDILYITDISVNKEVADKLQKLHHENESITIRLIDHHKNLEWLNEYNWSTIYSKDNVMETKCGTKLLLESLLDNDFVTVDITDVKLQQDSFKNLINLVDLVDKYDTWKWKEINCIEAKQLNDLMNIIGFSDLYIDLTTTNYNVYETIDNYSYILELEQRKINNIIKDKINEIKVINLKGYKAGVIYLENYISEVCNSICEMCSDIDLVIAINLSNKTVSLRSVEEDVDVSVIAKKYGGGGHKHASGFQINSDIDKYIIKKIL